jgi:hypothetical protein
MALVVTFIGKTALPAPYTNSGYQIWAYKVDASPSAELPPQQRIALGLPDDMDVQNPDLYPGVPQLAGTFLQRDPASSRQYVGRVTSSLGGATISFVAPAADSTCEMLLVRAPVNQAPQVLSYATAANGSQGPAHVMTSPLPGTPVFNGRPIAEFAGTLPYASEVFGVYQPLAGWLGAQSALSLSSGNTEGLDREMFSGPAARTLTDEMLAALAERQDALVRGVLSPVGLVNLFREYFFEFDTFLGAPAGHLWISPGGMVEVVQTSTRRTLVEKVTEQSEETSRKIEESLTEQDDIADAVKEENANDTKLGVSATGGANAGIYHADASANFSTENTVKRSSEQTHKRSRTQSSKVTSEIKRNFKTTFKTVTETTDTSSRRYVVQNTTNELVNYELRRKMRKVGVQLQHIGTRLCWQIYIDAPGRDLGMGDLLHTVPAPDLSALKKPEPPPSLEHKTKEFTGPFPVRKYPETANDIPPNEDFVFRNENSNDIRSYNNRDHMIADAAFTADAPGPGYKLVNVAVKSAQSGGRETKYIAHQPIKIEDADLGTFRVMTDFANSGDANVIQLTFSTTWQPPSTDPAREQYELDLAAYNAQVTELQHEAYSDAVRDRLELVGSMRPRPSEDLRSEERQTVYGNLIRQLTTLFENPHLGSELIRQIFDVEEMLYFVAPDFWRPHPTGTPVTEQTPGRYPVPDPPWKSPSDPSAPVNHLRGETVASWYSHTDMSYSAPAVDPPGPVKEWRVDYLITEDTQPAPLGSSLGWLIQIDGDARRNEFLNAAWAKAVLPVRPGHEAEALRWIAETPEGEAALDLPYPFHEGDPPEYHGLKVGQVLDLLAGKLERSNLDIANTLATEEVFETGFNPLAGGFRPADPYQIFDQWVEVLPTDQVVAVQVEYDPKTGQQL